MPLFLSPPADCFTQNCARLQCSLLPRMLFGLGPQNAGIGTNYLPPWISRPWRPLLQEGLGSGGYLSGLLPCQLPGRIDFQGCHSTVHPVSHPFLPPAAKVTLSLAAKASKLVGLNRQKSSRFGAPCFLPSTVSPQDAAFALAAPGASCKSALSPPSPSLPILRRHHRGLTMVRL